MELPIRWVTTFVAVVEQGHFGRAATALHLSPSAVSKHVHGLERELGVTLLVRHPAAEVELTSEGRRFVAAAAVLLAAHSEALASVRAERPTRTVRLGVLAGVVFSRRQVELVRATVALHSPGWGLALRRVGFTATTSSLLEGEVDVLWTGQAPRDRRLDATRLGELRRVGLVGLRHELAEAGSVDATTFAELPLLHNPAIPDEWMAPFRLTDVRGGAEGPLVPLPVDDHGAVVRRVATGEAVAVTVGPPPAALAQSVVQIELSGVSPMPTHAAYRRGDRRSVVRTVVDALAGAGIMNGSRPTARPAADQPTPRRRLSAT